MCKLKKTLYSLKQAPRAWFQKLHSCLLGLGFSNVKSYCSLFIKHTSQSTIFVLVYMDGILLTGDNVSKVNAIILQLNSHFAPKDLGEMNYFLGL